MNPAAVYSRNDVERWLGRREVTKALGYLPAVSRLEIQPRVIAGYVQGTAPQPYRVRVGFLEDRSGGWSVSAECSCPVGYQCKHGAAVLLAAIDRRNQRPRVRASVLQWVEDFRRATLDLCKPKSPNKSKHVSSLFYVLDSPSNGGSHCVSFFKARADAVGRPVGRSEDWNNVERALVQPPRFVDADDIVILRLLWTRRSRGHMGEVLPLGGADGDEAMKRMLATGRLQFSRRDRIPLSLGEARSGTLEWQPTDHGLLRAHVNASPPITAALALEPLWYVDVETGKAGPIELAAPSPLVRRWLALPPLERHELPVVAAVLNEAAPELPSPLKDDAPKLREIDLAPVPVLRLGTTPVYGIRGFFDYGGAYQRREFDYAVPSFRYGEISLQVGEATEFFTTHSGETIRVRRRPAIEGRHIRSLEDFGLKRVPAQAIYTRSGQVPRVLFGLKNEEAWLGFMRDTVTRIREAGWEVQVPGDFRHNVAHVDAWHVEVAENEPGWFDLEMGIDVLGKRLSLPPLLGELFRRDPRWLDPTSLEEMHDQEAVELCLPDGVRIRVEVGRLKPLVRTLVDLFEADSDGPLRLPKLDAPRLAELAEHEQWEFRGMEAVEALAQRLRAAQGIAPILPPRGLMLKLRPYQVEGLAWLQFLRESGFAGILADDMGLGKTVQTLAHLLVEKEAGRLEHPALIVLPTSLVHVWRDEAKRFAPGLSVLGLCGPGRKAAFKLIARHDAVLTTYPLLWRDREALAAHEYHLLILDEAQMVKNAASEAAKVVRTLKARHRLCLTGTPLENHLGELWSQFDFLMPGFLGDAKGFQRSWRTPIEKAGDVLRRDLLRRRVRPFILRRRKEDVAKELPAKTIIVRTVELECGQRDLYETVRSAMDARVRDEIAAKGFKRSQIVILDALLKLRQVCCDPRLLRSAAAQATRERAKLVLLMDMLPELVEEGRRVLLFSQFTSMLELIAHELKRVKIPFVTLTGDTADRVTPIARYQAGEVPLFLISLKAGGVGLNLTAADTVIHYDPWWNPAAENQATDRAHRIGQTKRVFVYKLIVAGSIEEKILALQEKKAELVNSILSDDRSGEAKFSESEIEALLAPLPPLRAPG